MVTPLRIYCKVIFFPLIFVSSESRRMLGIKQLLQIFVVNAQILLCQCGQRRRERRELTVLSYLRVNSSCCQTDFSSCLALIGHQGDLRMAHGLGCRESHVSLSVFSKASLPTRPNRERNKGTQPALPGF